MESATPTEEHEPAREGEAGLAGPALPAGAAGVTADMAAAPAPEMRAGLRSTMGSQCPRCDAHLAADQRYCVECGERSGDPRLPFMDGRTQPARAVPAAPPRRRRPRSTSSTALIAGVGTLLLAMATGVLIGRSGDPSSAQQAPAVQVVTVAGAGASGTPTTTAPTSDAATASSAKAKKSGGSSKADSTPAAAKAAPPPVVTVGSKGTGKGYKNGKFTGQFFGP